MQIEYGLGPPGDDTLTHGLQVVASGSADDDLFFVDKEAEHQAAKAGLVVKVRKVGDGDIEPYNAPEAAKDQ